MNNRFLFLEKELMAFDAKKEKKKHKKIVKSKSIYSTQKGAPILIAAGAAWKVYNILKEGSGLTTNLITMKGAKYPYENKEEYHTKGVWKPKTIKVYKKHIDGIILKDEISAKFDLRFQYNGYALGKIDITEAGINMGEVGGWKLNVNTSHMISPNEYNSNNGGQIMSMVEISFTYKWHTIKPFEDDIIKTVRYELYGDGTVIVKQ